MARRRTLIAVKVGIPREVKNHEYRVAITPQVCTSSSRNGHEVYIEKDAGVGSSIPDEDFESRRRHDPGHGGRRVGRPAT